MVIEDMVMALVALVAAALLAAGLAQALQLYPRRRVRRGPGRERVSLPPLIRKAQPESSPPGQPEASPADADAGAVEVPAFLWGVQESPERLDTAPLEARASGSSPPAASEPGAPPTMAPGPSGSQEPAPLPVEECLALYQAKRYRDLLLLAEPCLERLADSPAGSADRAHGLAALWSLVGLSRQALDAPDGARAAFEAAIEAAPESERPGYRRQLAVLAARLGGGLLTRAETGPEMTREERVAVLKRATLWLRSGLLAMPGDEAIASSLRRAQQGLWIACGQAASALLERREFHGAQRLIREALAEENLPPDRREALMDLLADSYAGEVWQLTVKASRSIEARREPEALTGLERAEGLLAEIPEGALTPDRWDEATSQLRRGYTRLGRSRVESGEFEPGLEALFHALRIGPTKPVDERETRQALGQALEALADSRAALVGQLLKDGKPEAALSEAEHLRALIRKGMDAGLTQRELAPALTKTRQLIDRLAQGRAR